MELLINDLSIQGQFPDIESFRAAIAQLMGMRNLCRRFGLELYCHKNMAHAQVTDALSACFKSGKITQYSTFWASFPILKHD